MAHLQQDCARRAQISTIDLVLAVIVFSMLFVFFVGSWSASVTSAKNAMKKNRMEYAALSATDLLLRGAGGTDPSLVLYLPLDEGSGAVAHDLSTYGNNGTLVNSPAWTGGKYGGALLFNSTSQYINCSNSSSLRLNSSFTLSAWIQPASASPASWGAIIAKDDESGASGTRNYWFGQKQSSNQLCFWWHNSSNSNFGICTTNANMVPGQWYYVAADVNNFVLSIYVNGTQMALNTTEFGPGSNNLGSLYVNSTTPVTIGRSNPNIHQFNGIIDEPMIFNRALSAGEIAAAMGGSGTMPSASFASSPYVLSASKIANFTALGYPAQKRLLGINEEFYFYVDINGTRHYDGGNLSVASKSVVSIVRYGVLDGNKAKIGLMVYG